MISTIRMFLKHEPHTQGYQDGIKQCYAIMQQTNPYCIDCLKWTEQNIEDLNKFVKYTKYISMNILIDIL